MLTDKLQSLYERYKVAKATLKTEATALKAAQDQVLHVKEAQRHLQALAQNVQQQAHKQIARVVSRCVKAVFGDNHDFKIEFEQKRGKTEARLFFLKNGYPEDPRQTSGGLRDVAGLALRLVALSLSNPQPRKVIFLDEPFQGLSVTNRPKIATLLETLSEELGIQIIMVTHDPELELGTVIDL